MSLMYVKIPKQRIGLNGALRFTQIDLNGPNVNNGKERGETARKTKPLLFKKTARW